MLITIPGDVDVRVQPGVTAAQLLTHCGLERGWCGPTELDPDHPVGLAPLVHAARITPAPAPACLPLRAPHLNVIEGPDAGAVAPLTPRLLVGRHSDCDVVVDDPTVSGEHATVTTGDVRQGRDVRVRDMRSENGTAAAGGRRLRAGDTFTVGRTTIGLAGITSDDDDATRGTPPMRWTALVAGLGSGLMLAAVTGRWALALVGVLPATLPWLAHLRRKRAAPAEPWQPPVGPLAVRGEPADVSGYVRAVLLTRERAPLEDRWREPWTRWLPPAQDGDEIVEIAPGAPWPSWAAGRIDVTADSRIEDDGVHPRTLGPLAMTAATADLAARRLAGDAPADELPTSVRWADLVANADTHPTPRDSGTARSLSVRIGASEAGPYALDLDADGPHFLVAGTTGAGKSVALETIVAALAHAHSPEDLNLALIDFKGGAGLRGCMGLPHVSATLTDLDGALANRAIAGLAHELETRKAALETHGLSSLTEWERRGDAPARLLVVIDEYQEIAARHSSFLPDLARIAAQGRSLGLHLILATQRPAGAVTPEVRANVSTTIALRVASDSESHDLLGTSAAAAISAATPGRAVISRGGELTEVQVAAPDADPSPTITRVGEPLPPGRPLADVATTRWAGHTAAAPLWRDPLPAQWSIDGWSDAEPGIAVGIADRPAERAQGVVRWDPGTGPAIIIGPPRSGRTGALQALAAQAVHEGLTPVWLPRDPRLASRTLYLTASRQDVLLLVDNMESVLAALATVDDGAAVEDLMRRPALRLPTAMVGGPGMPARLSTSAGLVAVLSGLEPTVAQQWGVPRAAATDTAASPGRGVARNDGRWDGIQLAMSERVEDTALVAALHAGDHAAHDTVARRSSGTWGIGGDDARAVLAPTGHVAVVGPPGPEREAVAQSLGAEEVTCVDLPALVPSSATTVIVTEPTARAVRGGAPHQGRGLTDPAPMPGHGVLGQSGKASAVRLDLVR